MEIFTNKKKTGLDYLDTPFWIDDIFYRALFGINSKIKYIPTTKPIENYDHVLINEYKPGDGCLAHTDELEFWEDWVIGVSFGSGCEMILSKGNVSKSIYLTIGSVYLLCGDARYKWTHEISFKFDDEVNGNKINRNERISLTFRTISNNFLSSKLKNKKYLK